MLIVYGLLAVALCNALFWPPFKGVDQVLLDGYWSFSPLDDNGWFTDIVMIRNDWLEAIAPAFEDWREVKVTTTEILPLP
jgi:hypothetical protein